MLIRTGRFGLVALMAAAALASASLALAQTTYYVNGSCGNDSWTGLSPVCEAPDGPKATIQAGINAADHFDSVEVANGIYRGEGNKNIEFFQKEMSIHSVGGPTKCIIDCENDGLGFTFCTLPDDRPVTIEGFTIRNGRHHFAGGICITAAEVTIDNCIIEQCVGTGEGTDSSGGGIMISQSPVLITRTLLRSNTVGAGLGRPATGGGIHIEGFSRVSIVDCRIEANEALSTSGQFSAGGGVSSDGHTTLQMKRCVVSGNRAVCTGFNNRAVGGGISAGGGQFGPSSISETKIIDNVARSDDPNSVPLGGGAYLARDCTVNDCRFVRNRSGDGGGVYIAGDDVDLYDSTLSDNTASRDGGGMYAAGQFCRAERLHLLRNHAERDGGGLWDVLVTAEEIVVAHNTANRNGGGIYATIVSTLDNSLIADDQAIGSGGGVFVVQTPDSICNVTFVGNQASEGGGGLHVVEGGNVGSRMMTNSILWNNSPTDIIDLSGGLIVGHCDVEGGWPGIGNLDVNPRFFDPNNDDYRLSSGSLCIDAGNNRHAHRDRDLAGQSRRTDDSGMPDAGVGYVNVVDMGAYEFQGTSEGFITVHPRPGVAGRDNQLQAAGAAPGHVVYFVYGFSSGSTTVPSCPGLTIDIASPRIAAQSTADANGYVSKIINIPIVGSGRAIILQAIDRGACTVSNLVRYRFP